MKFDMKNRILVLLIFLFLLPGPLLSDIDPKSIFDQGMEAFNSGNYGSAGLLFRKIIDMNNNEFKDEAYFYQARAIFYQKKYKSALFEFNSYLNLCRTSALCIESRYWMGESHFFLENYISAIEEYKRFIIKSRHNILIPSAHDRIGIIYFTQKRFDEAVIEWEKAISFSRDKDANAGRVLKIGDAFFRNGKLEESIKRLEPLLTSNAAPRIIASARLIAGKIYQQMKLYEKVIIALKGIPDNFLKEYPFNEALYIKAVSYAKLNNRDKAIPLLELFILIGKNSELRYDAVYQLGVIYIERNKEDKGIKLLEEVRKNAKNPSLRIKVLIKLSKIYFKKKPAAAVEFLREVLKIEKAAKNKEVLLLLGKAYIEVKNFDEAESLFDVFVKKYPFDRSRDEVDFHRARIYLEKGKMKKAIELFKNFQRENPFSKFYSESNYYLAIVNFKNNNLRKAERLLRRYLREKGSVSMYSAYLLLVDTHVRLKNYRRAGATVNIIIKKYLNKNGAKNKVFEFGLVLKKSKKKYRRYFDTVVKAFPDSEESLKIYYIYADDYFSEKNYKKAENYYKKYIDGQNIKNIGSAYFRRLKSLYHLKKYNEIIKIIKSEVIPPLDESQWEEIPLLLSRCYFKLKNYDRVYSIMYSKTLYDYPKEDLLIFIKSAIEVGDLEIADTSTGLLIENKNIYSEALYYIAEHYRKKGSVNDSSSYYSRIIIECPETTFIDLSRLQLAEIYLEEGNYGDATIVLSEIKDKKYRDQMNSLLIMAYFKNNQDEDALRITGREIRRLLKSSFGEPVVKQNMIYYYENNNIGKFRKYTRYLERYNGNSNIINYYTAKIYYKRGDYKRAFFNFYKISESNYRHAEEVNFFLGKISLFVYKKEKQALKYFKRVLSSKKSDSVFKSLTLLNVAIMMKEKNNDDESKKYLQKLIGRDKQGIVELQAQNLYEYYFKK